MAMNTVLYPGRSPCLSRSRFLPFCLQPPSGDVAAFDSLTVSSAHGRISADLSHSTRDPSSKAWASERTSLSARRLVSPAGRIEFTWFLILIICYGLAVHLRQLSTPCRHDAVAFGHRPVIRRPDGDLHPVM